MTSAKKYQRYMATGGGGSATHLPHAVRIGLVHRRHRIAFGTASPAPEVIVVPARVAKVETAPADGRGEAVREALYDGEEVVRRRGEAEEPFGLLGEEEGAEEAQIKGRARDGHDHEHDGREEIGMDGPGTADY